jgi:hypothetical protein
MLSAVGNPSPDRSCTLKEFFEVALPIALEHDDVAPTVVDAWIVQATLEDSSAHWNPTDTTQPEDGATAYNSFGPGGRYHVWNYKNAADGIAAFRSTLALAVYDELRAVCLRADVTEAEVLAAIGISPYTGEHNAHLYDGVTGQPNRIVEGSGGWPYAAPKPAPAPAPAPTPKPIAEVSINLPVLHEGVGDKTVISLRRLLMPLSVLDHDATFGDQLRADLVIYQSAHGLDPSGETTAETWLHLLRGEIPFAEKACSP